MLKKHYNSIGNRYGDLWFFSKKMKEWEMKKTIEVLDLKKTDKILDIGGGTGEVARLIKDKVEKVKVADPSEYMLSNCNEIECELIDAKTISKRKLDFNKILVKFAVHHIEDRTEIWGNMKDKEIIIITRPQKIKYPLWEDAKREFEKSQPKTKVLAEEFIENGFYVNIKKTSKRFDIPEAVWEYMLRNRFLSSLSHYTKEEIEKGILEIEKEKENGFYSLIEEIIIIKAQDKNKRV